MPEHGLAIAVLTNGGNMGNLWRAIYGRVLRDLAGLEAPPEVVPDPTATMPDTSRFLGRYANAAEENVIRADEDGRVFLDFVPKGISVELGELEETFEMLPYSDNVLVTARRFFGSHFTVAFLGDDGEDRTPFLYGSRIARRIND